MKSIKTLVLQTALMPKAIYYNNGEEQKVIICENFEDIFTEIRELEIDSETQIYVNRGPGSYSGLRTGISYVYGLLHGGLVKKENLHSYTSFDLIRAAEGEQDLTIPIYIKSWPRIPNGLLANTKGYFQEGDKVSHVPFELLRTRADLLIYTNELELRVKELSSDSGHQTSRLVEQVETYSNLVKSTTLSQELEPLYVNPVNITKRK